MSLLAFANVLDGGRFVERFHADPHVQRDRAPAAGARAARRRRSSSPDPPSRRTCCRRRRRSPRAASARRTRVPARALPVERRLHRGRHQRRRRRAVRVADTVGDAPPARRDSRSDRPRDLSPRRARRAWCGRRRISRRSASRRTTSSTSCPEKAVFRRRDDGIDTQLEIAVSPRTTSRSAACRSRTTTTATREIEVTSYAEIVLGDRATDLAHPAFGKLFVETEYLPEHTGAPLPTAAARLERGRC